jgi:DNA/RNA-binding domain of Phe-tRNA-synthetase-like protein
MPTMKITCRLSVQLAAVVVDGVTVSDDEGPVQHMQARAAGFHDAARARGSTAPGDVEGIESARSLFRALDIDPTRRRPCSEALLRRALKQLPMPRVSSLVDVGNWCALDFLLPLGVYDLGRLEGDIELRRGAAGESYVGHNGRDVHLEGRYLLADALGPFGSPITDSVRAGVDESTTRTIVILYAPGDYPRDRLAEQAEILAARIRKHCGGTCIACAVSEDGAIEGLGG